MLKALLTSQSLIYVVLRYVTYALAFINTLLLAKFLGGFEYGVYSFILLVMSYMSYSNFGINESLNTEYAKYKHRKIAKYIWDNAWSVNIAISVVITLLSICGFLYDPKLFSEYKFSEYAIILLLTCFLINLSRIYITFYKLHGKLVKLNIQQILPNLTIFVAIFILKYNINIHIITIILFVTNFISLIIFRIGLPQPPRFLITYKIGKTLIIRGLSLLIYNFSYSFFILLASSIVSAYYSVVEFGCFSLSNSMANGVIMAGGAFLFIFYPKILNAMNRPKEECAIIISRIKSIYVVGINIVCIIAVPIIWGISYFYPHYGLSLVRIFAILILGKCINNATTGFSAYLIANKKEFKMTILAIVSVGIEWILIQTFLFADLKLEYMALAVVIGSLIYAILIVISGMKSLKSKINIRDIIEEIIGNGNWLVMIILSVFAFVWTNIFFLICSLLFYYFFFMHKINYVISSGLNIIKDKNALNF